MRKLFHSKINQRIFRSIKKIGLVILILVFSAGMMKVGGTDAFFFDLESSKDNSLALGTLDMEVFSEENELQESEDAENMLPEDVVVRTARVTNVGTLPFQYNIAFQEGSGSDDLCEELLLTASKNGALEVYEGFLDEFDLNTLPALLSNESDEWNFAIELPAEADSDLEDLDCNFDFVFTAWQTDFLDSTEGWTDEEIIDNNNIHTGDWSVDFGDVVINEIMWMGSTEDKKDEWIELRNMTDRDIEIGKWTIENAKKKGNGSKEYMIPANNTIPANGYFLIANFPEPSANTALSVDPDVHSAGLSFKNEENGDLELRTAKKDGRVLIDQALGKKEWPAGIIEKGNEPLRQSMQRDEEDPGDGFDEEAWYTCTDEECTSTDYWDEKGDNYGTPGAENISGETVKKTEEEEEVIVDEVVEESGTNSVDDPSDTGEEGEQGGEEDKEKIKNEKAITVPRNENDDDEDDEDDDDEEDKTDDPAKASVEDPSDEVACTYFDSAHA